ncbi:Conidial yellow pigment biosynthesis polyketide synthase [Cytospora mali]|uniref:Conidial yellow pigment biosynthesis polyketide synthase n=1 Tax=Cytospora mali TaxID=578113 RepID=A0A194UMV1_CYTMA|nr:Conidial yellow pigment biosynthesis polyketide synthase [Valsa mali var. pyri (nom. inval.)]
MPSTNSSVSRDGLLVVGPKRSRFTPKDLSELHLTITSNPDLNFLPEAIAGLESLWPTIVTAHSRLKNVHGEQSLHNLGQFLKNGELANLTQTGGRHDNILLDVVTVLSHVVDFWCLATTKIQNALFTRLKSAKSSHRLHSIQGFCLGFLTAAAVSSARTKAEFATNVTTVLRITVCIGALVEADVMELEKTGTQAASLSVGWSSNGDYDALNNVLSMYSSGYIACMTDVTRATITILERDANLIRQQLSSLGLSIRSLPLQGRYHCRSTYEDGVRSLKALFQRDARFQLPSAASLSLPLRSNVNGDILTEGPLHEVALESILLHQCQWYETVRHAAGHGGIEAEDILQVGTETTVPRSLNHTLSPPSSPNDASGVAVIGMACRYPDADSLEEFWELLRDGISAVRELPAERFHVSEVTREPKNGAFWGNFLRHPDHFDHRFFGISGREAKYMDPQQRLALQVTYEVLESAGYFGVGASPEKFPADIGCYLGVGSVDYGDNVASHDATALSALGTLRAFISGRVSHHFGWSGPSITYDTACSSGAVAIHSAVTAIRSGECSLALAGGVNVITSPALFQNLAAASFLSPTGASKAFDASANGYCRGEGAGLVLLKSLARARADQDSILAVITGSAVNQGANCSPITVPVSDSQSGLYRKALLISGTDPKHVSFVEAHGTGTPVGDPIECESIRRTFGGSDRKHELFLGSVKDSIGHTEASSGAAALVKTVLMMQKRAIPKQAGFTRLNPKIPPLEPDRITVPRQTQRWTAPRRIAVVNNYGAAGSNAAIVVQDLDRTQTVPVVNGHGPTLTTSELPFFISAKTPESLREYCKVLKADLFKIQESHGNTATLNIAYNLSVKQNRGFECNYSFTASTLEEVTSNLDQIQSQTVDFKKTTTTRRPVVLCIGGQTGRTVHLDEGLFRHSKLLQKHLDACEQVCHTLGLPSLYPTIFSPEPVQDLVSLHSLLFSLQYASARAWLDSGLKVDTIIGHSFGQLTALVVTSALSLEDGLRYITARARLIQELWGHETGEMLSVKGDSSMVYQLIERTKSQYPTLAAEIGCYNGPQAVVLAGDRASIDALEDMVNVDEFSRHLKVVRLKNTHAFHSSLVDDILPGLREVAATLEFRQPSIHIEACSKDQDWNQVIDSETIVQHSRGPVYFHNAVQRIKAKLGPCVFLEAGSASPIVPMARRALTTNNKASNENFFQSIDIGPPNSLEKLAKAISNLWAAGVNVQYWPFDQSQKDSFAWINLPPYQFQKNSHWIEYIAPKTVIPEPKLSLIQDKTQQSLQLLDLYERDLQGITTFRINTVHEMFTCCARGHAVLGQSLCPASMYVEIAIRAANIIAASAVSPPAPCVKDLKISAALSLSSIRNVFLQLVPVGIEPNSWEFTVLSRSQPNATASTKHATGMVSFLQAGTYLDTPRMQFIRRLIGQSKYEELASARDAHILNGGIVYQVFGQVVDYAPYYRGVAQIVSKNKEAVGVVHVPSGQPPVMSEANCDPITLDNFLQVAGIHVNCLSERNAEEVYVCTEMGEMFISDAFLAKRREMNSYKVYTSFDQSGNKTLVNDIFVFDPDTGDLMVVFLGAIFQGVPMKSLARTLAKLNSSAGVISIETQHDPVLPALQKSFNNSNSVPVVQTPLAQIRIATETNGAVVTARTAQAKSTDVLHQIRELFSRVIEISIEEVKPSVSLSALGIDSLMSTEILNEIKAQFDIVIPVEQLLALDDVQSLAQLLSPVRNNAATPPIPHQDTIAAIPEPALSGGPNGLSTSFAQIQEFLSNLLGIPDIEIAADTSLDKLGIDSLMASEVLNEIKKRFDVTILAEEFQEFQDVLAIATRLQDSSGTFTPPLSLGDTSSGPQINGHTNEVPEAVESESVTSSASVAYDSFAIARREFDSICQDLKFADFYAKVYPAQMNLVVTYIAEAFQDMGCSLAALQSGEKVLDISVLSKHHKVKRRIYEILEDADIIKQDAAGAFVRTTTPVPTGISSQLHRDIVANFPQHAFEHNLLASTGPKLANCLTGKADPLAILFGSAAARTLMENVYTHAPMFKAGTINLARYLVNFFCRFPSNRPIRILELGAGTGGTTKHLLESLLATGRDFEYTFTDISSSLVAAARKKFAQHDFMRYALLNIEQPPASQFCNQYDIVLSTNCIHATKDLTRSCTNIRACLRPDGVLCLVELTRNLFWFDLVFGLLEGWWLFEDGRQHALASETLWRKHLLRSGFRWIDWTVGASEESNVLRVVTASPADVAQSELKTIIEPVMMETVAFKRVDDLTLNADIYYPEKQSNGVQVRPVALMIHGGGHVMLSRKDIRPPQTQKLLAAGFLPISIDYRLCPETTLPSGPMADTRDALAWVRSVLPQLPLRRSDIRADGNRVVAVGWSTGGHLALTLGFTAPAHGIRPPDATLVFYCPSDYEDPFWTRPNRPFGQVRGKQLSYDLLEGVRDRPITAYNPPADRRALGGWMSTADLRSRIALHMNWTGRYLRVLLNGLPPAGADDCRNSVASDPTDLILDPSREQIQAVSPLAQIRRGKYRVPTFIVHGTKDDLIPWQQAVRTYDALREQGVPAEIRILDGAVHLFDLYKSYESDASARKVVNEGYEMLARYVTCIVT